MGQSGNCRKTKSLPTLGRNPRPIPAGPEVDNHRISSLGGSSSLVWKVSLLREKRELVAGWSVAGRKAGSRSGAIHPSRKSIGVPSGVRKVCISVNKGK